MTKNGKLLCALLFLSAPTVGDTIEVHVLQHNQTPLQRAVVWLVPDSNNALPSPQSIGAIMDQVDRQFTPHVLTVQAGTKVTFPNSDSIKHHVYSFSQAKSFELELYDGLEADPVLFDTPGVVELGCNVHDWMLGYIVVVDTPYFGYTDSAGQLSLDVPAGQYSLSIWHSRLADEPDLLTRRIDTTQTKVMTVELPTPLLPSYGDYESDSDEFSEY
ncbi:methylamine utilization protein [Aestuariibacter salexigens]|uniref:methylamine utilization protein n=1 Tax=Aestuariibacter salexigens TaxID=226010 RepID=UPI0004174F84|nr:methylamine utilization protein [Aestuariibacter salexigens]